MPAAVDLDKLAVAPHADRRPHSDFRTGAQHLAGHLQRYREYVPVGERVLSGPLESVKGAVSIGEERFAPDADKQPARTGPALASNPTGVAEMSTSPAGSACRAWLSVAK